MAPIGITPFSLQPTCSDGTIGGLGGSGPPKYFQNFFSMCVLILAICFNKFALCPLNNIIDLFIGYKKFY